MINRICNSKKLCYQITMVEGSTADKKRRKLYRNINRIITFNSKDLKIIIIATSFILFVLSTKLIACPLELPTSTVSIKGYNLIVELAFTPVARSCGLSNRLKLYENNGMLFIYPTLSQESYWMKDTHIPLSIAFIDDSGKIINIQRMKPDQIYERYFSFKPFRYVLEVNQGWYKKHSIEAGDVVEIKLPDIFNIR